MREVNHADRPWGSFRSSRSPGVARTLPTGHPTSSSRRHRRSGISRPPPSADRWISPAASTHHREWLFAGPAVMPLFSTRSPAETGSGRTSLIERPIRPTSTRYKTTAQRWSPRQRQSEKQQLLRPAEAWVRHRRPVSGGDFHRRCSTPPSPNAAADHSVTRGELEQGHRR